MRRIFVCSPLSAPTAAGITRNIARAQELAKLATLWGAAAFAPHGFYPLFLDDHDPAHRKAGMTAGAAWLGVCHELWAWTRLGISSGMKAEIEFAERAGIPVVINPSVWSEVES